MARRPLALAAFLPLALLAACGGGGGAAEAPIAMTFTVATLTGTAYQGQGDVGLGTDVKYPLTARLSRVPTEQTFVFVIIQGQGFLPEAVPVGQNGDDSFSAMLPADTGLAPGTYSGTITVRLCHDAACQRPYAVTGNTVPYRVTVTPKLQVEVRRDGVSCGSLPGDLDACMDWGKTNALRVVNGSVLELVSNVPATFSGADAVAVPPGPATTATTWRATLRSEATAAPAVTVQATDGTGQQLGVGFIVDLPRLVLQETRVDVVAAIGQSAFPRVTLQVGTENGEPVGYTVTRSSGSWDGWLVGPTSGQAPGALTFDLAPGTVTDPWTYSALLALRPTDGGWASEALVRLDLVRPAATPASVRFALPAGAASATFSQHLALADIGTPRPWTATIDQPWLTVTPSGLTSGGAEVTLDPARVAALPLGAHAATVHFTLDMGSGATAPLEVPVTLDLQLARTLHAMPRALVAGLGGDVLVHGSDFPSGFTGPVLFGDRAATAVRRITDRTLRVTPPAGLALGTWPVRVENPLGLDRSDAEVVVVAPAPARAAATRASPGAKVGLRFDDATGTLWVANAGTSTVERYREAAGWAKAGDGSDERSLLGLKAIALAPDGATLVALAGTDVRLLDLASLALRSQQPAVAAPSSASASLEVSAAGQAVAVGYEDLTNAPALVLDLATLTAQPFGSFNRATLTASADGSQIAVLTRDYSFQLWDAALGSGASRATRARFGGLDRNADRLLVYGEVWRDPGDVFRTTSVLYDTATWNAVPGSVAGAIEPTAPVGAPPPTLAVALSPLGRARAYAWDGVAIRCYDLGASLAQLDAFGFFPVLWSAPAAPGANARLVISADERTAFLAGDDAVVVVPLPE